jgi:hypothetical protein
MGCLHVEVMAMLVFLEGNNHDGQGKGQEEEQLRSVLEFGIGAILVGKYGRQHEDYSDD